MEHSSPTTQALPAGTRLEEFEIEHVLGSGGFGITYLARDMHGNVWEWCADWYGE